MNKTGLTRTEMLMVIMTPLESFLLSLLIASSLYVDVAILDLFGSRVSLSIDVFPSSLNYFQRHKLSVCLYRALNILTGKNDTQFTWYIGYMQHEIYVLSVSEITG